MGSIETEDHFEACTGSKGMIGDDIPELSNQNSNENDTINGTSMNGSAGEPSLFTVKRLPPLDPSILDYPFKYISSLPSKGFGDALINPLNVWYQAPQQHLDTIRVLMAEIHNASLMMDDIQDYSPIRRGHPATHTVYGVGQTINSASFHCLQAFKIVQKMSPAAVSIFIEGLTALHVGQGMDLYWTYHSIAPTEEEYIQMVDAKTSAFFLMASRFVQIKATNNADMNIDGFITLFGRYFQILDDYQNLESPGYAKNKGFCSDFDEGKYSLPLIHALKQGSPEIKAIIQQRKRTDSLTPELKVLLLAELKAKGSLAYTLTVLKTLEVAIEKEIEALENETGIKNGLLWKIFQETFSSVKDN